MNRNRAVWDTGNPNSLPFHFAIFVCKAYGRVGDALWLARDYGGARDAYAAGLAADASASGILGEALARCERKLRELERRAEKSAEYAQRRAEELEAAEAARDAAARELAAFWRTARGTFASRWLGTPHAEQQARLRRAWPAIAEGNIATGDASGAAARAAAPRQPALEGSPPSTQMALYPELSVVALTAGGGRPLVELFQRRVAAPPAELRAADLAAAARSGLRPSAPRHAEGTLVCADGPRAGEVASAGDVGNEGVALVPSGQWEIAAERSRALGGFLAAVAEEHQTWQRQRDAERAAADLPPQRITDGAEAGAAAVAAAMAPRSAGFAQAKAAAAARRAERESRRAERAARISDSAAAAGGNGASQRVRYVMPSETQPANVTKENAVRTVASQEAALASMAQKMEALLRKDNL